MARTYPRSLVATLALIAAAAVALAACSGSGRTVVVKHAAPTPTVVPGTVEGTTVGTVRYFDFDGTANGALVHLESVMSTVGLVEGTTDEHRITKIVFTFANAADQLILEGTAVYPGEGSTLAPATTVVRPIVGGSGVYAGARGWAESTREADGSWTHTLHLE